MDKHIEQTSEVLSDADGQASEERARERHRLRMEAIMVIATVLSAIATMAAVGIGYFQYQAAHDALSAADRNRALEGYAKALAPVCSELSSRRMDVNVAIMEHFNATKPASESGIDVKRFEGQPALIFDRFSPVVATNLAALTPELNASLQRFAIWVRADQDSGIEKLSELHDAIATLSPKLIDLQVKDPEAFQWERRLGIIEKACNLAQKGLASWYRDSVHLDFSLEGA